MSTVWHVEQVRELDTTPEFLSGNNTWATIATARVFGTLGEAAHAAEHDVPAGTVGVPVPVSAVDR